MEQPKTRSTKLCASYAGAIAWWRSADLANGEFGEPVLLIQEGEVADMD